MGRRARLATLMLGWLSSGCGTDERTFLPLRPGEGWRELLAWQDVPSFDARGYRMFSSYDRDEQSQYPFLTPGNKDFNNFMAVCGERRPLVYQVVDGSGRCDDGIEGYLIAAVDGPGFVSRMLLTLITPQQDSFVAQRLSHERVRVYADDLSVPLYDVTFAELKRGETEPFVAPLAGWTSGAFASYVPIEYRSKLRIYLDGLNPRGGYYHQIETRSPHAGSRDLSELPATHAEAARTARERARDVSGLERWATFNGQVAPSQAIPLLDRAGGGTLRALHLRIPRADAERLGQARLEAFWDGRAEPAMRLPVAWLFGVRDALVSFDTLPMRVHAGPASVELSLYLPMPFAHAGRLVLTNASDSPLRLDAELFGSQTLPSGEWGPLHVAVRGGQEPFSEGSGFSVLELSGRGKYAGSVLHMSGRSDPSWQFADPFNFLEGDPLLTVDRVRGYGTGAEEYFDAGIYFREGTFDSWFASVPFVSRDAGAESASVALVRWNVLSNAIDFQNGFQLGWEYGLKNPDTLSAYHAVSFFYLK
jgi:hypothetical protein